VAYIEPPHAAQAADLLADTVSTLVLASRLAHVLAVGDDPRGEPADPRRAAQQVEVGLEAGGLNHFGAVDDGRRTS